MNSRSGHSKRKRSKGSNGQIGSDQYQVKDTNAWPAEEIQQIETSMSNSLTVTENRRPSISSQYRAVALYQSVDAEYA